ncbi:MAG TPA: phosphohistidine phosphatase SixA [Acidobacteriota bacterium]|nr:phosphohistidine phosphatase SixA [Acidobacteriota bacterium]
MILYIVRHAIAVPHGTLGIAEDDRPLTEEGIDKMKKAALGLKKLLVSPGIILSSPLPRAMQTAEIVRDVCRRRTALVSMPALAPAGSRSEVYHGIRAHKDADGLMLVGHQPSLGELAGEIAWGSAEHYVELKKGGACALELEEFHEIPRGTLLWLLTPSILRELAR